MKPSHVVFDSIYSGWGEGGGGQPCIRSQFFSVGNLTQLRGPGVTKEVLIDFYS